jgi:hypothetical protein
VAQACGVRGATADEDGVRRQARPARSASPRALWLLVLGLLVGGAALPRANDTPALREDYESCISSARRQAPPLGDPYGELVDALYSCGVYDGSVASR